MNMNRRIPLALVKTFFVMLALAAPILKQMKALLHGGRQAAKP